MKERNICFSLARSGWIGIFFPDRRENPSSACQQMTNPSGRNRHRTGFLPQGQVFYRLNVWWKHLSLAHSWLQHSCAKKCCQLWGMDGRSALGSSCTSRPTSIRLAAEFFGETQGNSMWSRPWGANHIFSLVTSSFLATHLAKEREVRKRLVLVGRVFLFPSCSSVQPRPSLPFLSLERCSNRTLKKKGIMDDGQQHTFGIFLVLLYQSSMENRFPFRGGNDSHLLDA